MREFPKIEGGSPILGSLYKGSYSVGSMFDVPDFVETPIFAKSSEVCTKDANKGAKTWKSRTSERKFACTKGTTRTIPQESGEPFGVLGESFFWNWRVTPSVSRMPIQALGR